MVQYNFRASRTGFGLGRPLALSKGDTSPSMRLVKMCATSSRDRPKIAMSTCSTCRGIGIKEGSASSPCGTGSAKISR
eukprot:5443448-Alexandrium_andersonii.AAC.1